MSRIRMYNSGLTLLGTVPDVLTAARREVINGDNVLTFSVPLISTVAPWIAGGNVAELDGDYFDVVYYAKGQEADGSLVASAECEHVSYRLNRAAYDLATFAQTGTPTAILTEMLAGTGFTLGTVEFTASVTYSAQQAMSRRALLMEFVDYLGSEVLFEAFTVSVVAQRGSTTPYDLTASRDLEVINKTYNARETDDAGNPVVSYTCAAVRHVGLELGDVVTLDYAALDIDVTLRVVALTTNPYNRDEATFEIGNAISDTADDLYRIETSTVATGKTYYGARISADNGFESIRSDNMARTVMNADTFAMQVGDGSGTSWTNKLYFDTVTGKYIFDGELSANLISALEAEFDVTISNTIIVKNLTAQKGYIASLTVDEMDTSTMVEKYKVSDTSDIDYQRIFAGEHVWITATVTDPLGEVQVTARDGTTRLYWTDSSMEGITEDVTAWPVMRYRYDLLIKRHDLFETIGGVKIPVSYYGAGTGVGNNGKAKIYKDTDGLKIQYFSRTDGTVREIRLSDDGVFITPYDLESIAFGTDGFDVTYSGETYGWTWVKDVNGRITQLGIDGRTIPVTWPS